MMTVKEPTNNHHQPNNFLTAKNSFFPLEKYETTATKKLNGFLMMGQSFITNFFFFLFEKKKKEFVYVCGWFFFFQKVVAKDGHFRRIYS